MRETGLFQSVPFEDGLLQTITACSGYDRYSLEELRLYDYSKNLKKTKFERSTSSIHNRKPNKLSRRKPLVARVLGSRKDLMDIDDQSQIRPKYSPAIKLSDVKGEGFAPLIAQSMLDLSKTIPSKEEQSELQDSFEKDLPYFSTPNLMQNQGLRVVTNVAHDTRTVKRVTRVSLKPISMDSAKAHSAQQVSSSSAEQLKSNVNEFTHQRLSMPLSQKNGPIASSLPRVAVITSSPLKTSPLPSKEQQLYQSSGTLQDVLTRHALSSNESMSSGNKLSMSSDISKSHSSIEGSKGTSNRESMLEDMNKELFIQLKDMRKEVERLRKENDKLVKNVDRLSRYAPIESNLQ